MKMTSTFWKDIPNFKPSEFKCKCGCEKQCIEMDALLIVTLQNARLKWGRPITITSGHRCQKYNDSLKNSVKNSKHVKKKAVDFYIQGVTDTEKGRKSVADWLKQQVGFESCYYMHDGKYTWMGNAIHVQFK